MPDDTGPGDQVPQPVEEADVPEEAQDEEASTVPIIGKVYMNHTMYPEGALLEVPGLGSIPNGGSKDVTLVMGIQYEQATGQKWPTKDNKPVDLIVEVDEAKSQKEAEDRAAKERAEVGGDI